MPGKLSTHALDIHGGHPARGLTFELWRLPEKTPRELVKKGTTNADGRTDAPLLSAAEMAEGRYEIVFFVRTYFQDLGRAPAQAFLDDVPVRFTIADREASYHVPLVFSPWAYSTYRGS
jgi:hydroxyisourate hydrolase